MAERLQNRDIWKSGHRDIGNRSAFGVGLGLGPGLGGPWVAQAWPKGGPRATQASRKGRMKEMLCLQQKVEKGRVGQGNRRNRAKSHPSRAKAARSGDPGNRRHRRDRKKLNFAADLTRMEADQRTRVVHCGETEKVG
jgi:hypothetical protein